MSFFALLVAADRHTKSATAITFDTKGPATAEIVSGPVKLPQDGRIRSSFIAFAAAALEAGGEETYLAVLVRAKNCAVRGNTVEFEPEFGSTIDGQPMKLPGGEQTKALFDVFCREASVLGTSDSAPTS